MKTFLSVWKSVQTGRKNSAQIGSPPPPYWSSQKYINSSLSDNFNNIIIAQKRVTPQLLKRHQGYIRHRASRFHFVYDVPMNMMRQITNLVNNKLK